MNRCISKVSAGKEFESKLFLPDTAKNPHLIMQEEFL
jgi:hypothetical protein